MIQKLKVLSSLLALLLCLGATAFAQETGGSIEVTVKDPQGAVVPNVSVTVVSRGTTEGARQDATIGFKRDVVTDQSGFVRILQVPPGFYTVTTAATGGFGGATVNNVEVILGKTTPVDIALAVGQQNITVDVTDAGTAIDPTDNKIQTNITAQVAELLPKGTNFTSLLKVSPSTRPEPLSGGFQVDGASGSENTFIIDGQEVTNFRTGVLNTANNLPFQLIQEVQVKSSGFEAEFGGATGGVINVVSKGGSNDWHGEFGITFQPSRLQAGPNPFLRRFATGSVALGTFVDIPEYIRPRRDSGVNEFPTGNFGGPIIKDKAWFFLSYSPQIYNIQRTLDYFVMTQFNSANVPIGSVGTTDPRGARPIQTSQTYNYKQVNNYAFARVDAAPTSKIRLAGTFTWNPVAVRGALPAFSEVLSGPQFVQTVPNTSVPIIGGDFVNNQGGRQNANNITGKVDWVPTSKWVISVRGGRSFLNEKLGSYGIPNQTRYLCNAAGSQATASAVGGCFPGFANFGSNFQIAFDVSIRKTLDADATYFLSNFIGRHQLKFGYQYNGISNNVNEGYRNNGVVVLYYGNGITITDLTGLPATAGALGAGYLQRFATQGAASSASQSVFLQDSWQPITRLTLNLGLRLEKEDVPSFSAQNPGINFGWGDKVAPRIGAAIDLTGDGKTKLFGFYGWFYDRFKYELPRGSFGGDFYRRDYFEILPGQPNSYSTYTLGRILGNQVDVPGGVCPISAVGNTGLTRCQFDFRIPSNLVGGSIFDGGAVDPNLKAMRQTELTFGVERDLGMGYLVSGRYTRKRIARAIEDIGIPTTSGSEAYIIGNPGMGLAHEFAVQNGFKDVPAIRNYDAVEVRLDKRFNRKYYFNASYTWSKLEGNYPGLANSYENGRTSPSVNRLFDLPFAAFSAANGSPANGRLPTDRPHVFKFYGAYTFDWMGSKTNSTEFSGFTTAQSGTPLTTIFTFYNLSPTFLNGIGDLGRTEGFTQTDFAIRHKYRFGNDGKFTAVLDVDILNLFNERNVLGVQNGFTSVSNITASSLRTGGCPAATCADEITSIQAFLNGGIRQYVVNYVNALASRSTSTYGRPNSFQDGRSVRVGFRLLF